MDRALPGNQRRSYHFPAPITKRKGRIYRMPDLAFQKRGFELMFLLSTCSSSLLHGLFTCTTANILKAATMSTIVKYSGEITPPISEGGGEAAAFSCPDSSSTPDAIRTNVDNYGTTTPPYLQHTSTSIQPQIPHSPPKSPPSSNLQLTRRNRIELKRVREGTRSATGFADVSNDGTE